MENNDKIAKENLDLLKSLDIDIKNLKSYHILYNTTPYTFGYKDSSMWAFSISEIDKTIQVHSTYFQLPQKAKEYNFKLNKKYWQERYSNRHAKLKTYSKEILPYHIESWNEIKRIYNLH